MSPGKAAFFGALCGCALVGGAILFGIIWAARQELDARKRSAVTVEATPAATEPAA